MKKWIPLALVFCLVLSMVVPVSAAEAISLPVPLSEAVDGVSAYLSDTMQSAGAYSEWSILQLARSGNLTDAMRSAYLQSVKEKLDACGGVLDNRYYSQYSRTIIGLTVCGADASNFSGYDLTAPLADYTQTVWQGINGAAYALIAMDTAGYAFPQGATNSRERLIAFLLDEELSDGGWAYSETAADPDMTAIVLQALAPYYKKHAGATASVDRALNLLSHVQQPSGGYAAWGTECSESPAQVLLALCSLGIDAAKDPRFVQDNGAWLGSVLFNYRAEDGRSFGHNNTTTNYMATEQVGYALAAYERLQNGQSSLYDMRDVAHRCVHYNDVSGHWARNEICWATERGLMNGDSAETFSPDRTLDRSTLATLLYRLAGTPSAGQSSFIDVPANLWYSDAIAWAEETGVVNGVGDGKFDPLGAITREQLAVMLWRYDGEPESTKTLDGFADAGCVSQWARSALAWAVEAGILKGMDGGLNPLGTATRAQAAAMLARYLGES